MPVKRHPKTRQQDAISPAVKLQRGTMLTDFELAELLGVAVQTVRNWRWFNTGPRYTKIGGRTIRYAPDDVKTFLENQPKGGPLQPHTEMEHETKAVPSPSKIRDPARRASQRNPLLLPGISRFAAQTRTYTELQKIRDCSGSH